MNESPVIEVSVTHLELDHNGGGCKLTLSHDYYDIALGMWLWTRPGKTLYEM